MILKKLFSPFTKVKPQYSHVIQSGTLTRKHIAHLLMREERVFENEFEKGMELIEKYPRSVSILGSARFHDDNKYYIHAENIAKRIVTELRYAVVTGGGPGIMEAANKGAKEAGGVSIGLGISLPKEQQFNPYVTESVLFDYFSSRKTMIFFSAECYLYYPGGFGTLDELFEVLTLMQTNKIDRAPIILVGKEFWEPLLKYIEDNLLNINQTINPEDLHIYQIIDDENEIMEIVKNAPYRETDGSADIM